MATVETPERKEVRAEARYVRTAPRKAQLVVEQIRGRSVPEARTILAFMTRDAARDVERVLSSAVANAEANHGLDGDELYVSHAIVGAGPTLKRWRARARGRVARIKKRTCHITISLALPEGGVIPAPIAQPVAAPPPVEEEPEAAPKPKRAPGKKAEEAPAAEDAPEAEEKPKKPKTAARTPRAKKTDEDKPKARATKKSSGSTSKTSGRKSKTTEDR
jgi:large subunit ribosomal protein L22